MSEKLSYRFNDLTKLLVFCKDVNYLAYQLGKYDIYLDRIKTIQTHVADSIMIPRVATVFFDRLKDVQVYLKYSPIRSHRIFKHAKYPTKKPRSRNLFYNSAKNLLSLAKGKTIRIKSQDRNFQKTFYEICLEMNQELGTNCIFDYDGYNILVDIKKYVEFDKQFTWIIILVEGLDEIK
jgi:hypothetical protein